MERDVVPGEPGNDAVKKAARPAYLVMIILAAFAGTAYLLVVHLYASLAAAILLAALFAVYFLPGAAVYLFMQRRKSFFKAVTVGLIVLGAVITLTVSIVAPRANLPNTYFGWSTGEDAVLFFGTIFTIWAAGATGLILLADVYRSTKERTICQFPAGRLDELARADKLDEKVEALRSDLLDGIHAEGQRVAGRLLDPVDGIPSTLRSSERRILDELGKSRLRKAADTEAVDELGRWMRESHPRKIFYFGSYSVVPGFWKYHQPPVLGALLELQGKAPTCSLELVGPDDGSVQAIIQFLSDEERQVELEAMRGWSQPAERITPEIRSKGGDHSLVSLYRAHVQQLEEKGARVTLLDRPWELSSITFAVASDANGDPIGSIFLGSPKPGDGLLPGEIHNVLRDPEVFIAPGDEVGSLLLHLAFLLNRAIGSDSPGKAAQPRRKGGGR